jgi:hypothetical protein
MRFFPIAIALGLVLAGPAAAVESAKMKGTDQTATAPGQQPSQSAKMHNQQKPSSHIKKITQH